MPPFSLPANGPHRKLRIAVIGGGVTGLAAAHRLTELSGEQIRPLDLTLYEAADRVGGVFGTRTIGEYRIETGADSFITDKPWALELCRRLGLEDRLLPVDERCRRALILHNGRPVPAPDGFQLMAPSRLVPFLRTSLLSPGGKLRVLRERFLPPDPPDGDESIGAFVRRRFGQEALERIVQPMVGGIYTADPDRLSLAATLPRFLEMEREHGSVIRGLLRSPAKGTDAGGARYGTFVSLAGGMSELHAALLERIQAAGDVRTAAPVSRIEPIGESGYRIHFEGRDERNEFRSTPGAPLEHSLQAAFRGRLKPVLQREEFDAVILCVPAFRAADMIEAWNGPLAESLREIDYASSAIVITGHQRDDVAHPLDAAGLVVPTVERRRVLAVSFLSRKFPNRAPDGRVILRSFVGGATQPELLSHSDAELAKIVRDELHEMLGVCGTREFTEVVRWERAMPQYHVGHVERVRRIEQLCEPLAGFELAGNAYRGVGIPDCIHDGERAAERAWEEAGLR